MQPGILSLNLSGGVGLMAYSQKSPPGFLYAHVAPFKKLSG